MTAENGGAAISLDSSITLFSWAEPFSSVPSESCLLQFGFHCHEDALLACLQQIFRQAQASWSPGCGGVWGCPVLGVGLCTCPS